MKARLQDKLPRIFMLPLIIGILCSIISTILFLIFYATNLPMTDFVKTYIEEAEINKSEPILSNLNNTIYKEVQGSIDTLMGYRKYYKFLIESNNLDLNNIPNMKSFISKVCYNSLDIYNNYTKTIEYFSRNNNVTFLDYAYWYINPQLIELDQLEDIDIKKIYVLANMILLFRSEYELNKDNPSEGFTNIYVGHSYKNLFVKYPVEYSTRNYMDTMAVMKNEPWCRDDNMDIPNYYFIKCRPWYQQAVDFKNNFNNLDVSMTTSYKIEIVSNTIGVTICIQTPDLLSNSNGQFILFCIDKEITSMVLSFDEYNNLLTGYYFIMRIKADLPIYYPSFIDNPYTTNIYQYEFPLNTSFYMNEVSDYSIPLQDFTSNLNNRDDMSNYVSKGSFYRNNIEQHYTIYPVYFNIDDDNSLMSQHFLSIIYITNNDAIFFPVQNSQNNLIENLIFQVIILIIIGFILFLICKYLLISIAINIVRPIKLMKHLIEGMNNKKISLVSNSIFNDGDREFKNEEDYEDEELIAHNKEGGFKHNSNKVEEFILSNDEDFEEFRGIRSNDIENIFNKLINLKKVVTFTQDTSSNVENESILNFLFARHTFKEVNNLKAKFLCDSNVGNLTLKCKKYDKAIFHLLESLKDPANNFDILEPSLRLSKIISNRKNSTVNINNIPFELKRSLIANYSKASKNFNISDFTALIENNQKIVEVFKKKFLDSRFPKLLYAFKKYYKNLNKLCKSKIFWDCATSNDLFTIYDKHSLEQYEKVLIDYCRVSNDYKEDQKYVEALLEHNEFLINFNLKPQTYEKKTFKLENQIEISNEIKKMKIEIVKTITFNFKSIDIKMKKLKITVDSEYLKKVLEMVNFLKKDSIEMIEVPIHVLNQKSNFLKGKFLFYCENYSQALTFFNESRKTNIISNAQIIKSSLKKIKKIMKIFKNKIGNNFFQNFIQNDKLNHIIPLNISPEKIGRFNKENRISVGNITSADKLKKIKLFKIKVDEFIKKYMNYPKDIAILINFSSSMINDSKKLQISLKTALKIFENFTTTKDRFCIFSYSFNTNPLINLIYKNINTVDYIKSQIENYMNRDEISLQEEPSGLIRAVSCVYSYLDKKNFCSNKPREKWIIAITDEISEYDLNFMKNNDIKEKIFESNNFDNLAIITLAQSSNEITEILKKSLNFNKSTFLKIEKLEMLKKKMRIFGSLIHNDTFGQEKYEKVLKI